MSETIDDRRPRGLTIQFQLVLMTGVVLAVAGAVFAVVCHVRLKQSLLEGIDEKLVASTQVARATPLPGYFDRVQSAENPVTAEEYIEIVDRHNKFCRELGLQYLWSCMRIGTNVVFTTATSPSKDVRKGDHAAFLEVHRDPQAFDAVFGTMRPDFSSFRNEWGHGRMVLVPYRDRQGRPYCVGASISIEDVHIRLRQTMWRSLTIGAVILLLGVGVATAMSTTLARPLIRLTEVADAIAHGNMRRAIALNGSVEMKRLARSLASMRDAIDAAMHDLREHRDHLEEVVARRTAALERSNEELEQFAYVASHDLREPLRKVKSFSQLFARKFDKLVDDEGRQYLHFMVDGAERMQSLIDDLLTYSRAGRADEPLAPADLTAVVKTVLGDVDAAIVGAGAEVTVEPLPTLHVNERLIGMVFQNLILNAVKFKRGTPPRVTIGAEHVGGEWIFSVADNGIGIAERYFDRIFQIFQRLHARAEYPGTGIGLAVCKKIVERHGGRIWLKSEPGTGSTFFFSLPETGGSGGGAGS